MSCRAESVGKTGERQRDLEKKEATKIGGKEVRRRRERGIVKYPNLIFAAGIDECQAGDLTRREGC